MKKKDIIQLISGPRNVSTALMYSFGNRKDFAIVDEPFYAYYLSNFDVDHPGKQETIASQSAAPNEVIANVIFGRRQEEYFFVKNMAHHMDGYDYSYSFDIQNVFLIRDPKKLITSFSRVIKSPLASDLGLKRESEIYQELRMYGKFKPVILDSGELLKNPKKVILELCQRLDIPFDNNMLNWKPGARHEDGIWAKYWYHNVHKSTGFALQKPKETILEGRLIPLYEEVVPYYNQLFEKAIKA